MTDRRSLLTGLALTSVAVSSGAKAIVHHQADPAAEYLATERALNAGHATEDQFISSIEKMDQWQPDTAEAFLRKFAAMVGETPEMDGFPSESRLLLLAQDAKRILGRG